MTCAPLTKPDPLTVNVCALLAPVTGFGETLVMIGLTELIVNVAPADVPPPGLGVYTVTVAVPAEAMELAGTWAVNAVVRPPALTM